MWAMLICLQNPMLIPEPLVHKGIPQISADVLETLSSVPTHLNPSAGGATNGKAENCV